MKKSTRLLGALLFGSVSFVAIAAHADEPAGWYVGAEGGLTHEDKLKTDLTPTTTGSKFSGRPTENSEIKNKDGWVGAAEVGYNWGNNIRTELEGTFAENSARRVFGIGASGRTDLAAGFVNAFYDFDLTQFNIALPIVPYIGAGAGAGYWGQQRTYAQGTTITPVSGNGFAFIYQAIGGFAYNVDDNWALTADFRYMDTPAADFGDNKPGFVSNHLHEEQILFGVRYTFTEPKPAPVQPANPPQKAPEAAQVKPVPATSFLVFFDFNKYNLTSDAQRIVDNAAADAKNGKVTRIDVTGHTDTVGSDAYNMKLSKRRAETVKAELVRQGIPAKEIMIYAKGKKDPLVPTGDGVREPQNRRVEIVFH